MWFFCFMCIWKSCFPFGFAFYHDAKFMQEISACIKSLPVRCQKVWSKMNIELFQRKKTQRGQYNTCTKKNDLFCFSVHSAFACWWCFYRNNVQSSFANTLTPSEELSAGRVHQCCCISNIFPNLCRCAGVCFSFESTGKVLCFTVDDFWIWIQLNSL